MSKEVNELGQVVLHFSNGPIQESIYFEDNEQLECFAALVNFMVQTGANAVEAVDAI